MLNGKLYYLGKYGSLESKEQYRRLVAEWTLRGNQMPEVGSNITATPHKFQSVREIRQ
jgi:hypothetical protein